MLGVLSILFIFASGTDIHCCSVLTLHHRIVFIKTTRLAFDFIWILFSQFSLTFFSFSRNAFCFSDRGFMAVSPCYPSSGTCSIKSDTETPSTSAILSNVSTFAPPYGRLHSRLIVVNETSAALDKLDML